MMEPARSLLDAGGKAARRQGGRKAGRLAFLVVVMSAASCRPRPAELALPCAAPESLTAGPLLFSNAIYGMRGTSGGTLLQLSRGASAWTTVLIPIESEFPSEDDRWPEAVETLSVRWADRSLARGTLQLPRELADTSANRSSFGDSIVLTVNCQAAVVENRDSGNVHRVELERKPRGEYPY